MAIKYDSEANDRVAGFLKESINSLNTGISSTILSDFSALTDLGLFSTQLNNLKKGVDSFVADQESFLSIVQNNKYQWAQVNNEVSGVLSDVGSEVEGGKNGKKSGSGGRSGGSGGGGSSGSSKSGINNVNKGKSISTDDVEDLLSKFDEDTLAVLLKKLYKMNGDQSIVDLLVDQSKSGLLLMYLKQILGDTTGELNADCDISSDAIQQLILKKINKDNLDVTTQDGVDALGQQVIDQINNAGDDSKLDDAIYGNNTVQVSALDGEWIVADTKNGLETYVSYVASHGIKQDADTSKYGDSCLAFAGAHAYDLYYGTNTGQSAAGNYAHASSFEDYIDDDKQKVLEKIYSEIKAGRPVVLQVNGNKAGTSRHFVTVVGFKKGVTSGSTLTEDDLLIIDSWDGKLERMDTEKSRFFTTGKACHKDYSGYRLRVFKSA